MIGRRINTIELHFGLACIDNVMPSAGWNYDSKTIGNILGHSIENRLAGARFNSQKLIELMNLFANILPCRENAKSATEKETASALANITKANDVEISFCISVGTFDRHRKSAIVGADQVADRDRHVGESRVGRESAAVRIEGTRCL